MRQRARNQKPLQVSCLAALPKARSQQSESFSARTLRVRVKDYPACGCNTNFFEGYLIGCRDGCNVLWYCLGRNPRIIVFQPLSLLEKVTKATHVRSLASCSRGRMLPLISPSDRRKTQQHKLR